jgi:protoporphyrin/coproporphyrin ferrochelatase
MSDAASPNRAVSDAVLLVSHGSVDDLEDLRAFVTNVRRGRPPSAELLAELRRRYEAIGGRSPLHAINAEVARKLGQRLNLRVAWANRLFVPYVRDILGQLAKEGVTRVALLPLAQHSAHVYAEDARRAVEEAALAEGGRLAEPGGITLLCASNWGQDTGLHAVFASRIASAVSGLEARRDPGEGPRMRGNDPGEHGETLVLMSAHSLPRSVIDAGDPYEREVRSAAAAIAATLRERFDCAPPWSVAFQSQGASDAPGRPVAWLGPDLRTALDEAKARGARNVVFAPIGFLADHVEILYDLDIEARQMATDRGLSYARAALPNADDDFVEVLARLARTLLVP